MGSQFLKKLSMYLAQDSAASLLGICPQRTENLYSAYRNLQAHTKLYTLKNGLNGTQHILPKFKKKKTTCTKIFTTVLFRIASNKCLSVGACF